MPFGEIVTSLRADLAPLEQDLKKAEERIRAYLGRVNRLHAQVSSGGAMAGFAAGGRLPVIGAGGSAAQAADRTMEAAERAERRMRQLNVQAEAEYRRLLASRDAAYKEDEQRRVAAAKNGSAQAAFQSITAAERASRRMYQLNVQAEADFRRLIGARAAAYKEDEQKRVAAAKRAAAEERRVQEQALGFYRRRSGLGAVGGGPAPGPGGGPGNFLTPPSMRGLDEVNSKWLKQQQAIASTSTLTERLSQQFKRMGEHDLNALIEGSRQFANWLGVGLVGAATGLGVAFAKYALDTDTFFERSKVTIAEVLALTTKVVDKQGRIVDYAKQQNINYALSAKLIEDIRTASIRTSLPAQTLANVFARTLGFAVGAGATPQQAVPLVAQVTNLARALGSRSEREFGFENRALFTGQNITRSRIGQALSLTRQDIEKARETGTLIQFLTDRLKAGQPYLDRWATSWDGLVTTFQTKFQTFVHTATGELYDRIRERLAKINQSFDPDTIERWGKAFAAYLLKAWDRTQAFFESDGFKQGFEFFKFLAGHARQIVEVLLAFKALEGLTRAAGVIAQLYQLTKSLGIGGGVRAAGQSIAGVASQAAASSGAASGVAGLASRFMRGFGDAGLPATLPANQVGVSGITRAFGQGATTAAEVGILTKLSGGFRAILPEASAVATALPLVATALLGIADAAGLAYAALLLAQKHAADVQTARTEQATREIFASPARLRHLQAGLNQPSFADLGQTRLATSPGNAESLARATAQARQPGSTTLTPGMSPEEIQQRLNAPSGILATAGVAGLRRVPVVDPSKAQQANLLKMQMFVHRILASSTDDEKEQLREREKAQEGTVQKTLGATKQAYDLIHRLRAHLNEKLQDIDRDSLFSYQKMLATMSGSKAAQLDLEYRETLKSIEDGNFSEEQQTVLRKGALAKRTRDLKEEQTNQRLAAMEFQSNVTDDELKQISLRNARELVERYKQIGQDTLLFKTANEKKLAYQQAFNQEYAKTERERLEKVKEFQQRATDLQRQAFDQQASFHKARVTAEREYQELQQRTAKELRDLLRERRDAQRELRRAQEDLPQNRENIQLNRQQRGIRHQIEQEFLSVASPNSLSSSATLEQRTKIRQLAGQLASGDVFSSQQALQEAGKLGYLNQYNAPNIRNLSRQSSEISFRREDIADQEAERGENRQMEDADRGIEDLKRRATDLDQRQTELVQSYKDTATALRENMTKTVVDTSESVKKLNEEMKKLAETLRASHLPVPAALAVGMARTSRELEPQPGLRRLPDGTITNVADRTMTTQPSISAQGGATLNFIFNGAEFSNLPADAQEAAGTLAQTLLNLSRRTRPTTR